MAITKPAYIRLDSEEDRLNELGDLQDHESGSRWPNISTIVLSITTVIFGLQSIYLFFPFRNVCFREGELAFEHGYITEWAPAKAGIELSKVVFKSALQYNETSKEYYREQDHDSPHYVGPPSPAIDRAWEELLSGQYIVLTEEEGLHLDNPVPIQGLYLAELEVMHSLHCLNVIRKSLTPEYYSVHEKQKMPAQLKSVHDEHCLEQLRQTIQCAGDLTPVPLRPYGEGENLNYVGNPQVHTCRNWDTFRKWYSQRGYEYGRVHGSKV